MAFIDYVDLKQRKGGGNENNRRHFSHFVLKSVCGKGQNTLNAKGQGLSRRKCSLEREEGKVTYKPQEPPA